MAVLELVLELEQRFGITIEGEDVTADVFETPRQPGRVRRRQAALTEAVHDLAIITVSTNEAHWIRPCLPTVFEHMGDISGDVVVVDNDSQRRDRRGGRQRVPARAHACGRATTASGTPTTAALMTCNARYVLFLNPDTEILEGTLRRARADDGRAPDRRPRRRAPDHRRGPPRHDDPLLPERPARARRGAVAPSGSAASARAGSASARSTPRAYERETDCDWTSGSFMLARREALESAGYFDERFFMYSDETDLCRRIKLAGWEIRHLPQMTILHHDRKAGIKPHIESLGAITRMMVRAQVLLPRCTALAYRGAVDAAPSPARRLLGVRGGRVSSSARPTASSSARCSGANRCRSRSSPARSRSRPPTRSCGASRARTASRPEAAAAHRRGRDRARDARARARRQRGRPHVAARGRPRRRPGDARIKRPGRRRDRAGRGRARTSGRARGRVRRLARRPAAAAAARFEALAADGALRDAHASHRRRPGLGLDRPRHGAARRDDPDR